MGSSDEVDLVLFSRTVRTIRVSLSTCEGYKTQWNNDCDKHNTLGGLQFLRTLPYTFPPSQPRSPAPTPSPQAAQFFSPTRMPPSPILSPECGSIRHPDQPLPGLTTHN